MRNNTQFITGLKALGAMMIVISHLKMQFSGFTDLSWKLITFPAYFIVLFVCISAFTISISLDSKKNFNIYDYMKRRWIRLAPVYYFSLFLGLFIKSFWQGWNYFTQTFPNLPFLVFFLNLDPIHPKSQSSILGVEWMLPIMFWLYLLIPFLLFLLRKKFSFFVLLFALSIFLHFNSDVLTSYKGFGGFAWSLQFYIIMYTYTVFIYYLHSQTNCLLKIRRRLLLSSVNILGILLSLTLIIYYLNTNSERLYACLLIGLTIYLLWIKRYVLTFSFVRNGFISGIINNLDIVILGVILVKYMINLYYIKDPHIILTLWFVALLIAGTFRPLSIRFLFENKYMHFLGIISFEIYLIHPLVIFIVERITPMEFSYLRFLLIIPLTIFVSYYLYKKIELPIYIRYA